MILFKIIISSIFETIKYVLMRTNPSSPTSMVNKNVLQPLTNLKSAALRAIGVSNNQESALEAILVFFIHYVTALVAKRLADKTTGTGKSFLADAATLVKDFLPEIAVTILPVIGMLRSFNASFLDDKQAVVTLVLTETEGYDLPFAAKDQLRDITLSILFGVAAFIPPADSGKERDVPESSVG